jgi:hypothetical protein
LCVSWHPSKEEKKSIAVDKDCKKIEACQLISLSLLVFAANFSKPVNS